MSKKEITLVEKEEMEPLDNATVEALVFEGNLAKLTPAQRVAYYNNVCHGMGLNPATKPFGYIQLNGKLVLYALRNCTDQLMSTRGISTEIVEDKVIDDLLVVKVKAWTKDGRQTVDIGALTIRGLSGDAKANAFMKALTKAKRRAVLSLVGLSFPDETEVETIPGARVIPSPTRVTELEREASSLDTEFSQVVHDVEPTKVPDANLSQLRAKVLNALVGRGKPFGSNAAGAKAWVQKEFGCEVAELTEVQCVNAMVKIVNIKPISVLPLPPVLEPGDDDDPMREPGEDDEMPDLDQENEPYDHTSAVSPQVVDLKAKPTAKEIEAIKKAFGKSGIGVASAPEFLKFLVDGRKSHEWSRADFENLKSFLKDHYVDPS